MKDVKTPDIREYISTSAAFISRFRVVLSFVYIGAVLGFALWSINTAMKAPAVDEEYYAELLTKVRPPTFNKQAVERVMSVDGNASITVDPSFIPDRTNPFQDPTAPPPTQPSNTTTPTAQ